MAIAPWLQAIAEVRHPGTRGTAFIISDTLALTACHVLEALVKGTAPPSTATVELRFTDHRTEPCRPIAWDEQADWLLLQRLEPAPRPALRLMVLEQGQPDWRSAGFPEAKPDGLAVGGRVTTWQVAWEDIEVIQLLCTEALAGNLKVKGLSGAPCIVGNAGMVGVVGLLRKSLFEDFTEFNAGGTVFACSTQQILRGLQTRGIAAPPPLQPARLPRLSQLQRERTLGGLEQGAPFQPELHTPREPVESFLASLLDAHAPTQSALCAIVGGSGVGKTQLLASVAHRMPAERPVLLIRARMLDAGSRSLADVVRHELETSAAEEGAPTDFDVMRVWQDSDEPRLILLDALNELPGQIDAQTWIEQTVSWLQASPSTLLAVSCRPEYWERCSAFVPGRLRVSMPTTGPAARDKLILMGDFNAEEADDALQRAFGGRRPVNAHDVIHPLLLRVYRELDESAAGAAQPPGKAQAFGEFIRRKVNAAALKFQDIEPSTLHGALRALAARIALGDREAGNLLGDRVLLSAIRHTGLLDIRVDDLAFVHDEVLEYLASTALRLADFDDAGLAQLKARLEPHRIGALKFALMAALLADGADAQARRVLQGLLIPAGWALDVVADVLVSLPDATPFTEQIGRYFELRTYKFLTSDPRRVLPQARIDTRLKLQFLLAFREEIEAFDFEMHHWHDIDHYALKSGPMDWVQDVIEADPAAAFDELESWLGDSRPLSDNKAKVSGLAGGLLYQFAALDFERVCRAMVRRYSSGLTELLTAHPQEAAALARQWLSSASDDDLNAALPLCDWIVEHHTATPEFLAAAHLAITRLPAGSPAYRSLRRVLLKAQPDGHRFNAELLTEFEAGRTESWDQTVSLEHLLRTEFDIALAALERLGRVSDERMSALGDFVGSTEQHASVVRLLRRIRERHMAGDFRIAHAIEVQLRCTPVESIEQTGLVDLAREVLLGTDESMSRTVFYAVLARLREPQLRWPQELLHDVIAKAPNAATAAMLLDKMAMLAPAWPAIGPRLGAMRDAVGEPSFSRQLLHSAAQADALANQLVRWIPVHPDLFESGLLLRFKALVDSGIAPMGAASQLWGLQEEE